MFIRLANKWQGCQRVTFCHFVKSPSLLATFLIFVTFCHFFPPKSAYFCYFSRNSLLRVPNLSFLKYFLVEQIWNNRKNLLLLISKIVNTRIFSLTSLATFYFLSWDAFKKKFLESLPLSEFFRTFLTFVNSREKEEKTLFLSHNVFQKFTN